MPDIYHDFQVQATPERVFGVATSDEGLSSWWTLSSRGNARPGGVYELDFGPGYQWEARVSAFETSKRIEWEMIRADGEWEGTRFGFEFEAAGDKTNVRFHHVGWPENSEHFRISCYCWAMYLRLLKRYIEEGEIVPYANRLDV